MERPFPQRAQGTGPGRRPAAPLAGPKALGTYCRRAHPGAGSLIAPVTSIQRCINAGAQNRRPVPFLAFQAWSLLHGMTDLCAGKPEMPWHAADEMIDHFLV